MIRPALLILAALLAPHNEELRVRPPAEVGMSAERLEMVDRVINKGRFAGGFPGAAVIIGRHGAIAYEQAFGTLSYGATSTPVSTDESIYDLASLTKVVGTTTGAMVLFDEGKLKLDDKVSTWVPDFTGGMRNQVTVRMLLSHRGGLPAGRELWRKAKSPAMAREMVVTTKLASKPGAGMIYSDLGADILGWVVEAAAGEPLDTFLAERVFRPLGMRNTGFRPADSLKYRIAPTEVTPPRGYPLRGEVHDENAYALGGVAGHAGLFGSAADLAVFAQMMLNRGEYNGVRVVDDSTVRLFTQPVGSGRALGWAVAEGQHGSGDYFGPRAFGHTGYTGTSLWMDPDRNMFVVLLTNRVHAARVRRPSLVIADVRQDLADIAALAIIDQPFALPYIPDFFRADRAENWNRPFRSRARRAPRLTASAVAREAAAQLAAKKPKATRAAAPAKSASKPPAIALKPAAKAAPSKPIPTKSVAKR